MCYRCPRYFDLVYAKYNGINLLISGKVACFLEIFNWLCQRIGKCVGNNKKYINTGKTCLKWFKLKMQILCMKIAFMKSLSTVSSYRNELWGVGVLTGVPHWSLSKYCITFSLSQYETGHVWKVQLMGYPDIPLLIHHYQCTC